MLNAGDFLQNRYEIINCIGSGGMADVYKAKCHKLNRFVAVKVLKQEFSESTEFVSKFRTEAQAAAGLMHPNIVNVYDVGEEEGNRNAAIRILGLLTQIGKDIHHVIACLAGQNRQLLLSGSQVFVVAVI